MTQTILLIWAFFTFGFCAIAYYFANPKLTFAAVAALAILSSGIYFSLDGAKGWPAEEPTEVKGMLASVVIVNPTKNDKGGIYIGIFLNMPKKMFDYEYPRSAPKTFYVEYSNDRAAKFEMAKKALEDGKEVRINGIPPKEGTGNGKDGEEAEDGIVTSLDGALSRLLARQKDTYKPEVPDVEILAPVIPPEKGNEQ